MIGARSSSASVAGDEVYDVERLEDPLETLPALYRVNGVVRATGDGGANGGCRSTWSPAAPRPT